MEAHRLEPMEKSETIYCKAPHENLELPGGSVPVFSARDAYTENYERIAADHIAHFEATGQNPFIPERLWQESERITAEVLRRYGASGARVLDVGCGMGRLLEQFPHFNRYGMDISAAYLAHAQRHGMEVCLARVEDMPYNDRLFDVVVCTDVLEHVFDLQLACNEVIRVTRDDGFLIVRVPFREDLACYLSPSLPYEYVHLRNFDEHGLRLLFEKIHGCEVVELINGPLLLPWVSLKCRLRVPGMRFLFRTAARAVGLLGDSVRRAFLNWAFDPSDINVVVRVRRSSRQPHAEHEAG